MKIQQIIYMDRDMEFEVIVSKKSSESITKDDLDKDTIDDITDNYDEIEYDSGEDALNDLLINGCDVWVRNNEAVYKSCIIDISDINIIQDVNDETRTHKLTNYLIKWYKQIKQNNNLKNMVNHMRGY